MSTSAMNLLKTMHQPRAGLGAMPSVTGGQSSVKETIAPHNAFSQVMKRQAQQARTTTAGESAGEEEKARREKAEKAAGDLVSNALILPMLKQVRRSPWGENGVFSRGIGEKAFGPQFDMQISDKIAHSPRLGLKAALTERLIKRGQTDAPDNAKLKPRAPETTGSIDVHG